MARVKIIKTPGEPVEVAAVEQSPDEVQPDTVEHVDPVESAPVGFLSGLPHERDIDPTQIDRPVLTEQGYVVPVK